MIDKNYLKAISCFNSTEYQNNHKEIIEFKTNDSLDYCKAAPCQYYTLFPEIANTISNTPWEAESFPFSMEVLRCADNDILGANSVIQIITVDGEWRRRQFKNSLTTWWGEWINIEKIINNILANENIQKFLTENWDRYMAIDKNYLHKREWKGGKVTIDKIIEEINNGTAKIYRNKLI